MWSFQAASLSERLLAAEVVRPDARRAAQFLRPRYRHLRSRAADIFDWEDRPLLWAYGSWEAVVRHWRHYSDPEDESFLILRIPASEVLLLDSDAWDYALMRIHLGHRPGACPPGCRPERGYEWPCSVQRDFYRRAEAHHNDDLWHVGEDRRGNVLNQDDPWVQGVMRSWDQVFLPAAPRRTELVAQQFRPEWVVSARLVGDYRRRPTQSAADVTSQPAFAAAQRYQEEAVLAADPWVVNGPSHLAESTVQESSAA